MKETWNSSQSTMFTDNKRPGSKNMHGKASKWSETRLVSSFKQGYKNEFLGK